MILCFEFGVLRNDENLLDMLSGVVVFCPLPLALSGHACWDLILGTNTIFYDRQCSQKFDDVEAGSHTNLTTWTEIRRFRQHWPGPGFVRYTWLVLVLLGFQDCATTSLLCQLGEAIEFKIIARVNCNLLVRRRIPFDSMASLLTIASS